MLESMSDSLFILASLVSLRNCGHQINSKLIVDSNSSASDTYLLTLSDGYLTYRGD